MQRISFKNGRGLTLRGWLHAPRKPERLPEVRTAILFLHGFPSSSRGFTASRMKKFIGKLPYFFMAFDFSGSDTSDGKFEDKLLSREVEDVKYAIDFLEKNYLKYGNRMKNGGRHMQLVLMGHSTGAIIAALYAHRDKRLDKLILMGAEGDLKRAVGYDFTPAQQREFWTKGHIRFHRPGHWVHGKKLKKAYYDEFFKLDLLGSLARWRKPLLIVHGGNDEYIPADKDPVELYQAARCPKKLVVIRGADHRFTKVWHFARLLWEIKKFLRL